MGYTTLRREVLPPRPPPSARVDLASDAQVRASIKRAIWISAAIVGIANVAAHVLGTW